MSKTKHIIKGAVMKQILSGRVTMKPRWYFVVGSLALIVGLVASTIASIFLVSIIAFSLRTHGPMGAVRFQQLTSSFPLWAPLLAVFGIASGVWFLKQYDVSYKKNFPMIVLTLIVSVLLAGWLMDATGMTTYWSRRGSMKRLYQQTETDSVTSPRGQGWGRMRK